MRSARTRPMISMLVASTAAASFLAIGGSAVASAAPRTETLQSLTDATGDNLPARFPQGDLTQVSINAGSDGVTTLRITVAQFDSPLSNNWQGEAATGISWDFDVDNDEQMDFYLDYYGIDGGVTAEVFNANDDLACAAAPAWDAPSRTYSATLPSTCIGNPGSFKWQVAMRYEGDLNTTTTSLDFAPDDAWGGPVNNDAVNTPPPTPDPPPAPTPCAPGAIIPAGAASDGFVSLVPARLLDTRAGLPTIDCQFAGLGQVGGTKEVALTVTGRGGVPAEATAVVLNVTATGAGDNGYVTVYPCGAAKPITSNVNYLARQTVPNAVIAMIGTGGAVCLFSNANVDLIADVTGYFTADSSYRPTAGGRSVDTRSGPRLPAGSVVPVGIAGGGSAGVMNVTVTDPLTAGFATVYPCGQTRPLASNVNFAAGATVANSVIAKAGAGGTTCIYLSTDAHLVVDEFGYFEADAAFQSVLPARLLETRAGASTIDGVSNNVGLLVGPAVLELQVAGRGGVLANASAVVLNVTVDDARGDGFITVFPCGSAQPNASSLNYVRGSTVSNSVTIKVGTAGKVCFFSNGSTHLVVDVNGYYPAPLV
jgi:hypothetical protein